MQARAVGPMMMACKRRFEDRENGRSRMNVIIEVGRRRTAIDASTSEMEILLQNQDLQNWVWEPAVICFREVRKRWPGPVEQRPRRKRRLQRIRKRPRKSKPIPQRSHRTKQLQSISRTQRNCTVHLATLLPNNRLARRYVQKSHNAAKTACTKYGNAISN